MPIANRATRIIGYLSTHQECTAVSDLLDALDTAIMNREEGIILKTIDGIYVPNEVPHLSETLVLLADLRRRCPAQDAVDQAEARVHGGRS